MELSMANRATLITGRLQQFLFSPKGDIEGILLIVDAASDRLVQITFAAAIGHELAALYKPGNTLSVRCRHDQSPKTKKAAHAVFELTDALDGEGRSLLHPAKSASVKVDGTVTGVHFTRHGEANGVILESGDVVHLRPHGMKAVKPAIGSRLSARGVLRKTALGGRIVEAKSANGWEIE
jgi:hypothetical protein